MYVAGTNAYLGSARNKGVYQDGALGCNVRTQLKGDCPRYITTGRGWRAGRGEGLEKWEAGRGEAFRMTRINTRLARFNLIVTHLVEQSSATLM